MGTRVTCHPGVCDAEFELDSPEEDAHYVWSLRPDGTRSNLGECPVVQGSVEKAKQKLYRNGHVWYRNGLPMFQVPPEYNKE
jgi:hypothetical protein